jgi:hypothetical protein
MRWKKLGHVFDVRRISMPEGSVGYAQAPQALVVDDVVRVFFSTRVLDSEGMFVSRPAFADLDRTLTNVLRVSALDLLPVGGLGTFDEHGIFPMSVVRVGPRVYGYTTGWSRRVAVPVETAIGLAISDNDGLTFERFGPGPILAASPHEPFLVGDAFVRAIEGRFHMWHIFGTSWMWGEDGAQPERTYKIGHATSLDGIAWDREDGRQIVPDRLGPDEAQALPTVLEVGGVANMAFCYRRSTDFRTNPARSYRIGFAQSTDLQDWHRLDDPLEVGGVGEWDGEMQCYPSLFALDDDVFLFYNGNEFGRHGFGVAELER